MYNNGRFSNFSNASDYDDSRKISDKLKICMYLLFSLAFFRIFCIQFYGIVSDLIAAFIVYCTYISKGRIMAMFCLINAFLGIIYSVAIGSMDLSKLNRPQIQKSPYSDFNYNQSMNFGNLNNANNPNSINSLNSSNTPNKNIYGLNDFSSNKNDDKNKYNNLQYGNYNDINNNYNLDFLGNQDFNNNSNINNQPESRSFSYVYILSLTIFSVVIYSVLSYYSYKAFEIYKYPFGEMSDDAENSNGYFNGQNYGGVDNNRNTEYGGVGRTSSSAAPPANNRNFVPFGGAGQRLGE